MSLLRFVTLVLAFAIWCAIGVAFVTALARGIG